MFGIHDFLIFIFSGFLLNLTPGPDSVLIMSKSASGGWKAGSVATLGICSGCFIHVFAAALGLSAILASSATAFTVVKLVGAAYLIYMGLSSLFSRTKTQSSATTETQTASRLSFRAIYLQGFLSNVLNPKVALFFMAFVPQFINHDAPDKAIAFLILGTVFVLNSMLYCHLLAVFSAFASKRIKVNHQFRKLMNRLVGAVFVGLGLKLATATAA